MTRQPDSPEPLTVEEEARLRRVLADESLGRRYVGGFPVRRLLATLDAARSAIPAAEGLDEETLARAWSNVFAHLDAGDWRIVRLAAEYARLRSKEPTDAR